MKKVNGRKKLIISILVFFLFVSGVLIISAASKYYEHKWTNKVKNVQDYDDFITNDVLEIDDGFIAVGFENVNYQTFPSVRILNEKGELKKEVELDEVTSDIQLKRIIEYNDQYAILGVFADNICGILLNKDLEFVDMVEFETSNDYDYTSEVYLEEDDKYFYIFSDEYMLGIDGVASIIRFDKTKQIMEEILEKDYDDRIKIIIDNYGKIWDYSEYNEKEYYPVFIKKYNDGYVYGLSVDTNDEMGCLLVYYKNGKEVWLKELENTFYRDAIEVYDRLLLTGTKYDVNSKETSSFLLMVDEEFNVINDESINNYLDGDAKVFWPEHLINVGMNGFALTGSVEYKNTDDTSSSDNGNADSDGIDFGDKPSGNSDMGAKPNDENGEPPLLPDGTKPPKGAKPEDGGKKNDSHVMADVDSNGNAEENKNYNAQVLYFNLIHQVYTKTDGNGTVKSSRSEAGWGEEINFTITPNEGYIIDFVKVTDAKGNVVIFTENTFTMPNADVTIEVAFKIENPKTVAFISGIVIILLFGSGFVFFRYRNKIE